MKQAVLVDHGRVEVREVPEPVPGRGEVLVQIKSSGICGSDVHTYKGEIPLPKPPFTMGHEFAGIIADVGEDVRERKVGDRVAVYPILECGACSYCELGRPALCGDLRIIGGAGASGGHAEYLAIPQEKAVPIPDGMSYEEAALIEPTAVAFHATDQAVLKPGESVLILGAGTIGIIHAQVARLRNAGQIVVASRSKHKLELAEELGADAAINTIEEDPIARLGELCGPRSIHCVFDYVANQESVDLAMEVARSAGTIVQIGFSAEPVKLSLFDLMRREIRMIGSSCHSISEFHRAIQAWKEGLLRLRAPGLRALRAWTRPTRRFGRRPSERAGPPS